MRWTHALLVGCLIAAGIHCGRKEGARGLAAGAGEWLAAPAPGMVAARAAKVAPAPPPAAEVPEGAPRLVIRTAELAVEVAAREPWTATVTQLVDGMGGFVVSASTQRAQANVERGQLVVRVPSTRFDDLLAQIRAAARTVESEEISGQDVTAEYYDVEARLTNHRRAEERFREILRSASKVEDVLAVERELSRVREEIDVLEGRRKYLGDQVALSTVTVQWHEPYPIGAGEEGQTLWDRVRAGFARGLQGLAAVVEGLIAFAIAVLPVVLFVGLLGWGVAALVRWRRGRGLL